MKTIVAANDTGAKKVRGRPFQPGNKMGRGRPKGSRNRVKTELPGERLLNDYAEPVMRKCLAQALQGEWKAMQMILERISPARRGALVRLDLPQIHTMADVVKAADKITRSINRGKLTPAEGGILMATLETRARILERTPEPAPDPPPPSSHSGLEALTDEELDTLTVLTLKVEEAAAAFNKPK